MLTPKVPGGGGLAWECCEYPACFLSLHQHGPPEPPWPSLLLPLFREADRPTCEIGLYCWEHVSREVHAHSSSLYLWLGLRCLEPTRITVLPGEFLKVHPF